MKRKIFRANKETTHICKQDSKPFLSHSTDTVQNSELLDMDENLFQFLNFFNFKRKPVTLKNIERREIVCVRLRSGEQIYFSYNIVLLKHFVSLKIGD